MQILNLDKNFKPFGETGLEDISRPFPSGVETNMKIKAKEKDLSNVLITARFGHDVDIMKIVFAVNTLRKMGTKNISLFIPYLPYARQDRYCDDGEAFALKAFAEVINSLNLSSVSSFDAHSDISAAVINNFTSISNHKFVNKVLEGKEDFYIVAPDAGAAKKIWKVSENISQKHEVIQALKHREPGGTINFVKLVCDDLKGKDAYIIDDICDGGRTFVMLAEGIKKHNPGKIHLVVSHGIFSQKYSALLGYGIDAIHTTDSFMDHDSCPGVTEYKLEGLMS